MHNFCDKREQSSLLRLPSGAKIMNEVSNFCDKREQSSLLRLPSGAKITTEVSNFCDKREYDFGFIKNRTIRLDCPFCFFFVLLELAAEAQFFNDSTVAFDVNLFQVVEHTTTLPTNIRKARSVL